MGLGASKAASAGLTMVSFAVAAGLTMILFGVAAGLTMVLPDAGSGRTKNVAFQRLVWPKRQRHLFRPAFKAARATLGAFTTAGTTL